MPKKYSTEAERQAAKKASFKKYNSKRYKDPIKKKKFLESVKKWQNTPAGKASQKKNQKIWNEKINDSGLTNVDALKLRRKNSYITL